MMAMRRRGALCGLGNIRPETFCQWCGLSLHPNPSDPTWFFFATRPCYRLMQFIRDIYATAVPSGRPVISFEFFPPKTEEGDRTLLEKTIPALLQTRPDYCSVTYGAGGSTREKTL